MLTKSETAYPLMHQQMLHVAGVVKLLEQYDLRVMAVRANTRGAQIKVNQALIPELITELSLGLEVHSPERGEAHSLAKYQLFGVWITW